MYCYKGCLSQASSSHILMTKQINSKVPIPITKVDLTVIPYDKNPIEILSGSTQQFQCTTNAGRPSSRIEWYLSGTNITEEASVQTDQCDPGCNETLISSSVLKYTGNRSDIGKTIYCVAENVKEMSVRSLDTIIDILYPPVIADIPDYNIIEGKTLYITSFIDANPNAMSVWWTRQNDTSYIHNGMNLTINNIQRDYDDYYKCNAMNTITIPSQPTKNKTTKELFKSMYYHQNFSFVRYILDPPSVYIEPMYNPLIVQEDQQNIILSCMIFEANPVDDLKIPMELSCWYDKEWSSYYTNCLKMYHGLYLCTATNSVGKSASSRKQIDVHYEPVISGIQDYNIEAGRTLNVTPTVDAYPPPTSIWWTRQNNIKFIYYGWNLTIINIQESDSDNYACHVMNTLTPSGLSAQNRTSITVFNINVQKNSNSKVYESELDKPRQTSGVDNHLYNELQDLKSDGKQQNKSSERCSNTYEEFGEVKSSANDNIYENLKISTNEIQIRQKDTNLYVNLELKPSTRT
ncbi:unnamed protein product [Mytilus edulis]|uniref:Ig-like domain-containing protein n=1 Tax=Mytilus edulis TaxID=6550 RepID=A0A8S3RFW3_MYTED|nr:unnamed protein product [Mytilus edulis]